MNQLMTYVNLAHTLITLGLTTIDQLETVWRGEVSVSDLADIRAEVNRRIARRGGLPGASLG